MARGYTASMVLKPAINLFFLAGLLSLPTYAGADSYRCGRKLVRTGDSAAKVLEVCGEPRFKSGGQGEIRIRGVVKQARVQRWHYRQGSRRLEHVVLIYKGKVAAIEVAGR